MGLTISGGGGGANLTYQVQSSITLNAQLIPNCISGALSTLNIISNRCYSIPFILGMDYLCTKIAVEVTTPGALAEFYLGIYELDDDFMPLGAPIISSTALSGTTTGLKTYILGVAVQLNENKKYSLAILSTVNIGVRAVICLNRLGGSVGTPSLQGAMYESLIPGYTSLPTSLIPTAIHLFVNQFGIALYRN